MALEPEIVGLKPERQANQLRKVQNRHLELASHDAFCCRLLEVEVEMA